MVNNEPESADFVHEYGWKAMLVIVVGVATNSIHWYNLTQRGKPRASVVSITFCSFVAASNVPGVQHVRGFGGSERREDAWGEQAMRVCE